MSIKYYYNFDPRLARKIQGTTLDRNNWEILRNNQIEKPFAFEKTKEEYIENIQREKGYQKRAKIIAREIKKLNVKKVVSVGCGKGILEFYLKRYLPDVTIVCSEYTESSLNKLKEYSNCDDFIYFDILEGDYLQFDLDTCLLFYRVSTGFSFRQWEKIFKNIYKSNVLKIIFVPTELITIKDIFSSFCNDLKNLFYRKNRILCGWMYTNVEFQYFLTNSWKNKKAIIKRIRTENSMIYVVNTKEC